MFPAAARYLSFAANPLRTPEDIDVAPEREVVVPGKVRELVSGFEGEQQRKVRFAHGIESPIGKASGGLRRAVEPPELPSPTAKVSAQLLAAADNMNRGLQKTNDRLHEELVACDIKADRAARAVEDANNELEATKRKLYAVIDELTAATAVANAALSGQFFAMNRDNNRALVAAVEKAIKEMCNGQHRCLETLINNDTKPRSSSKTTTPLKRIDENAGVLAAHKKFLMALATDHVALPP